MANEELSSQFLEFIRSQAAALRRNDRAPASIKEWEQWQLQLRKNLQAAWGPFPTTPCDLQPKIYGVLEYETYRVEKLTFQTRPDILMTANAYVPKLSGKLPAVLCVHGHWKGAKQDPHVQARCIGLAKLGFFVLAVDAFGAGERAIGTKLGEYHGEMIAGTLWPTGLAFTGLQVYENMRAVDYLLTRPEVNGEQIGITGASGGGNQTMYAGAWDNRFKAVVPVCSVGNYQSYLGVACCMCEVVPGALQFTEEWALLASVAPRALMVINASKDSVQFSIAEAQKSLALASPVFKMLSVPQNLRHTTFDSPHDYSQPMREAMYGWMSLHLKQQGTGEPIPEGELQMEDMEKLRCFPNDSRPQNYVTIPQFAHAEAKKLMQHKPLPDHTDFWESEAYLMREGLEKILGPQPEEVALELQVHEHENGKERTLHYFVEPQLPLSAIHLIGEKKQWVILIDTAGAEAAARSEVATALVSAGCNILCPNLRATGKTTPKNERVGRAPDHNAAEWSLWLGRPLAAQWAWDIRRSVAALLESIDSIPEEIMLVSVGDASIASILAASDHDKIRRIALIDPLVSYVTNVPYEKQRMANMIPGMLRYVGDIPQLAALLEPRKLLLSGGVNSSGESLDIPALESHFHYTRTVYGIIKAPDRCVLTVNRSPQETVEKLLMM